MVSRTGIGAGIGIPFKNNALKGDKPYLPPEIKDSLKAVVIAYGKTNNDSDRAIVKNLVDPDNPFVISNAAFKPNSGFGGFVEDFTSWDRIDSSTAEISNDGSKIKCINTTLNVQYLFNSINRDIPSFKVKISNFTKGDITYYYRKEDGIEVFLKINPLSVVNSDKVIELPKSYNTVENGTGGRGGFYSSNINIGVTIEQILSFEGAFVTDGIDDLITSTKTVQEMLGGSNEITVVSMIHGIGSKNAYTNVLREYGYNYIRNTSTADGKTGIYGYTSKDTTKSIITDILGDKNDYKLEHIQTSTPSTINSVFSVAGWRDNSGSMVVYPIAWYWTIIANKVLTTDQINQVIAYFNLDRTLKPDILCNTIKQGITNENHAEFGDKLIDFSGNGRDIQLNNIAWKGDSGIGKYAADFTSWTTPKEVQKTSDTVKITTEYTEHWVAYLAPNNTFKSMKVLISGIPDGGALQFYRTTADGGGIKMVNGINEIPEFTNTVATGFYIDVPLGFDWSNLVIEQIPSHAGALCLDGVNDFGQFVGDLGLKDYTLIMNRAYNNLIDNQVPLISSNIVEDQTPFIVEHWNTGSNAISFSYGASCTTDIPLDINKKIVYQSTYSYMGYVIPKGNAISTGNGITLGKYGIGIQYSAICLWSLMLFPYSMSEFLIERQLKKHKLGTLYPNMVEFRPVIKSNASYDNIVFYYKNEKVENGTYLTVGSSIGMHIRLSSNSVNEIKSITINGIPATFNFHDANNNIYQYDFNLTSKSPQKINITIDEYIRYEDIVQPYPVLLRFKDENGNEVSWGGKFKVGSTITRIGSIADPESNLLNGLYSISGLSLNGKAVTSSTSIVEKQMVFRTTATWLLDDNEPKVILSPSRLRIPNSSYKLLGYIPDISGHGNNGVINNSAYAEGSGVNEDGSYQFDGVDDFVTIPTTVGGKQVLMKVNWQKEDTMIYNQNPGEDNFAIYANDYNNNNLVNAYASRNNGSTYIDGILNNNILATQLKDVTHNITITNENVIDNTIIPVIGANAAHDNFYAQMSLYDLMLFDEISTDDKIKELNEYVGIEAKVELPPYYWDAYGKTNLDADKATIQQRGVAVGDYDLTNTNFAYDKMSGFGGYTLGKFTNSWSLSNNSNSISIVAHNPYDITLKKLGGNSDWEFNTTELKIISNPVSVKFKSDKNIRFTCDYHYYTVGGNSEGVPLGITSKDLIANEDTIITISPISQENIDKYNIDINRVYYLIYFQLSPTLAVNEEVTIEMLPLYPNGLVYDGVDDYSKNENIPVLTDYTIIAKRLWINKDNPLNEQFIHKGDINTPISESAFMLEYEIANDTYYRSSSYSGYINIERSNRPERIVYQTSNSYNGTSITKGSGTDTTGIVIGGVTNNYWNGVFYKLMLYSKTLPLLQINYLKNLMERDEIIDLNNSIFIQE